MSVSSQVDAILIFEPKSRQRTSIHAPGPDLKRGESLAATDAGWGLEGEMEQSYYLFYRPVTRASPLSHYPMDTAF